MQHIFIEICNYGKSLYNFSLIDGSHDLLCLLTLATILNLLQSFYCLQVQ